MVERPRGRGKRNNDVDMPRRAGALSQRDFAWAYARLDRLTPLERDCGELCSRMCCHGLEKKAGMYLFPGEEVMLPAEVDWFRLDWHLTSEREFCPMWEGKIEAAGFLRCKGSCPREHRPLACRLFPLAAVLRPPAHGRCEKETAMDVILDPDAAILCPLARYATMDQLDPEFVRACREVYARLAEDPLILEDLRWQAERRGKDSSAPWRRLLDQQRLLE